MSMNDLISKIEALNEWETLMNEAKAEAKALRDSIKAEMLERNTGELTAGAYIIRWTTVLTQRFDSTAFKKAHEDLYKDFTKQTARHHQRLNRKTLCGHPVAPPMRRNRKSIVRCAN